MHQSTQTHNNLLLYNNKDQLQFYSKIRQIHSIKASIQQSATLHHLLSVYTTTQQVMIPRTYAFVCRKLAYFCRRVLCLQTKQKVILSKFYTKLLEIDIKLLTPDQCNNILFFLRITKQLSEQFNIPTQQLFIYIHKLISQALQQLQYLQFNKLCDFYEQLSKFKQIFNITRQEDQQNIIKLCLIKFPNQDMYKQIDSIFHLTSLYFNILQKSNLGRYKEIYLMLCKKVKKLAQYLGLYYQLRAIDINSSRLGQLSDEQQMAQYTRDTIQNIQIKNQPQYKPIMQRINSLINQLKKQKIQPISISIQLAKISNDIKKVPKTDKEIQKLKKEMQKQMDVQVYKQMQKQEQKQMDGQLYKFKGKQKQQYYKKSKERDFAIINQLKDYDL